MDIRVYGPVRKQIRRQLYAHMCHEGGRSRRAAVFHIPVVTVPRSRFPSRGFAASPLRCPGKGYQG